MTFCDPIHSYARANPNALAIVDLESDRRWTYGTLNQAVDRLAAWIEGEFGPNSGVRLATLSKNCAEMVILQHAGARAGSIFVPFNWRLASAEIDALAADAEPEIVFHDPEFAPPSAARRAMAVADMLSLGQDGDKPSPMHAALLATSRLSSTPPAPADGLRASCSPKRMPFGAAPTSSMAMTSRCAACFCATCLYSTQLAFMRPPAPHSGRGYAAHLQRL